MAWIYLVIAGSLEVAWAHFMMKSSGFTLLAPAALTLVTMIASFAARPSCRANRAAPRA